MANSSSPWKDDPHFEKQGRDWLEYLALTTDYISIPLCFFALLCDVLLISVILKYKRLKTRTNYYLLNFAIFHIVYIVSTPIFYLIIDFFFKPGLDVHWYCTWSRIENFAMALLLTFIAGYGIDLVLEENRPEWFPQYQKRYPYLFSFFYFLHTMVYAISAIICFKDGLNNNFNFYFLTMYYLLHVIFLLYLGIINKDDRLTKAKPYGLSISVTVALLWLPLFSVYTLMNIVKNGSVEIFLWYIAFLPEFLAYFSSLVVVWKLWKSHKQFETAFRILFKRQVPMSDYEELFLVEDAGNTEQNKLF